MTTSHAVIDLAGAMAAIAVILPTTTALGAGDAKLRADLEALMRRTLFFGHQSVGGNILEGVADLARQEGVPLRIVEAQSALGATKGTWAHAAIADNGNPQLKIQSFEKLFASAPGARPEIAFMKFCYVDFHQGTDARGLFASYQAALKSLQARNPGTTFVHVTAPLTTVQGGLKALAKRLLGRETSETQNARRQEFNSLMRQAYQGREPLFDLARVESTGRDGSAAAITWEGKSVPVLVSSYTDDGGHLNGEGRRLVARELVAFLASLPPSERTPGAK